MVLSILKFKGTEIKFVSISNNEVRFKFMGTNFLLVERSRGVYGIGSAIQLYELRGLDRIRIKEIGWLKDDNHRGLSKSDSLLREVTSWSECQKSAISYISSLLVN